MPKEKKYGNLLVVDDEVEILKAIRRQLRKKCDVHIANSAEEGYRIMSERDIQVIISDQRMPRITGMEFLKKVKFEYPNTIRLVLTGYTDINSVISSVNEGNIFYYLTKPWNPVELEIIVEKAFQQYWLVYGNKKLMAELKETNAILKRETDEKNQIINIYEEKNRQLKILLKTIPDIVYFKDKEKRFLIISRTVERSLGLDKKDIIGKTNFEVLPPELAEPAERSDQEVIENRKSIRYENTIVSKDGSKRFFETIKVPICDKQGNSLGLIGVSRDITERKQVEKELIEYRQHLEELVIERTTKLTLTNKKLEKEITERKQIEKHLRNQTKALKLSNKELEQFAYVASHDLQEPLRAVAGYLQLLERRYADQLDEEANSFIARSVDAATRMKILINALLSYSRVSTQGKAFEPVEVSEALEWALANLQHVIKETQATIIYDSMPTVMADGMQLAQLFQNLIGNAIKFRSGHQLSEIHVGVERQPEDSRWLFWVKDNGIGVETQYAERIFLIFQRLHTRSDYDGTGIGLAICKKIVERHNGTIWIESELEHGSTFFFTIADIQ